MDAKIIYDESESFRRTISVGGLSVLNSPAGMRHNVSHDNFANRFVVGGTTNTSKSNASESITTVSENKSPTSSLPGIPKKSSKEGKGWTSISPFPSRKSSSKNSQHSEHSRKLSHSEIINENEATENGIEEGGGMKEQQPLPPKNILT